MSPTMGRFLTAAGVVVVTFEQGLDCRKALVELAVASHEMCGERPCIRCDQWTPSDSGYCVKCDPPAITQEEIRDRHAGAPLAENRRIHLCSVCVLALVVSAGDACHECRDAEAG